MSTSNWTNSSHFQTSAVVCGAGEVASEFFEVDAAGKIANEFCELDAADRL